MYPHEVNVTDWTWRRPSYGSWWRTCSYCGSMHPEDIASAPETRFDWADRKYGWPHKAYLHFDARTTVPRVVGSRNFTSDTGDDDGWIKYIDMTLSQRLVVVREGYAKWYERSKLKNMSFLLGTKHGWGKFYTAHIFDTLLDPEVVDAVNRMMGLRFWIADSRIYWEPV